MGFGALGSTFRAAIVLSLLLAAPAFSSAGVVSSSDVSRRDLDATGSAIERGRVDPQIARALNQISAARIGRTIETLVSSSTRSTLSSMEPDLPSGQGVSAAADWIEGELKGDSQACGGCLEVKRDTFTEPPQTGAHRRIARLRRSRMSMPCCAELIRRRLTECWWSRAIMTPETRM